MVEPREGPRGMIVTLWSGSVFFEQHEEDGVAGLVIGGLLLVLLGNGEAAAFLAPAHLVAGFLELGEGDGLEPLARGEEGGLVDDVGEFGARVAGGAAGDQAELDAFGQLHLLRVDAQDFLAAVHVGEADGDFAVEAAGAEQGRVEDIGRFVAAMMMTPSWVSKPSISTRRALRVCSRSSCPPPRPWPR